MEPKPKNFKPIFSRTSSRKDMLLVRPGSTQSSATEMSLQMSQTHFTEVSGSMKGGGVRGKVVQAGEGGQEKGEPPRADFLIPSILASAPSGPAPLALVYVENRTPREGLHPPGSL